MNNRNSSDFNIGPFFRIADNRPHDQGRPQGTPENAMNPRVVSNPSYPALSPSVSQQIAPNFANWTQNPTSDARQQASIFYQTGSLPKPPLNIPPSLQNSNQSISPYSNLTSRLSTTSSQPRKKLNAELYAKALARKSELGLDNPHSAALEALRSYSPDNNPSSPPPTLAKKSPNTTNILPGYQDRLSTPPSGSEGKQPFYVDENPKPLRSILKRAAESPPSSTSSNEVQMLTQALMAFENVDDEDKFLYGDAPDDARAVVIEPQSSSYSKWSDNKTKTSIEPSTLPVKEQRQSDLQANIHKSQSNKVTSSIFPITSLSLHKKMSDNVRHEENSDDVVIIEHTRPSTPNKPMQASYQKPSKKNSSVSEMEHRLSNYSRTPPMMKETSKFYRKQPAEIDSKIKAPPPPVPPKQKLQQSSLKPHVLAIQDELSSVRKALQSKAGLKEEMSQEGKKTVSKTFLPIALRKPTSLIKSDKVFEDVEQRTLKKNTITGNEDIFAEESAEREDPPKTSSPGTFSAAIRNVIIQKKQENAKKSIQPLTKLNPKVIKKDVLDDSPSEKPEPFSDRIVRLKTDKKLVPENKPGRVVKDLNRKDRGSPPHHLTDKMMAYKFHKKYGPVKGASSRSALPEYERHKYFPEEAEGRSRGRSDEAEGRSRGRSDEAEGRSRGRSDEAEGRSRGRSDEAEGRSRGRSDEAEGRSRVRSDPKYTYVAPHIRREREYSKSPHRSPYDHPRSSSKYKSYESRSRVYSRSPEAHYSAKQSHYKDKSLYKYYERGSVRWPDRKSHSRSPDRYSEERSPRRWSAERSHSSERVRSPQYRSRSPSDASPHYTKRRAYDRSPSEHSAERSARESSVDKLHSPISTSEDSPSNVEEEGKEDSVGDEKSYLRYSHRDVYENVKKRGREQSPPLESTIRTNSLERTSNKKLKETEAKALDQESVISNIETVTSPPTDYSENHSINLYSLPAAPITAKEPTASGSKTCDDFFEIITNLRNAVQTADSLTIPTTASQSSDLQSGPAPMLESSTMSQNLHNFTQASTVPPIYSQNVGYANSPHLAMPQYSNMDNSFATHPVSTYSQNFMHNYVQYNPYNVPQHQPHPPHQQHQHQPPYYNAPPYVQPQSQQYLPPPMETPEILTPIPPAKLQKKLETRRVCSLKEIPMDPNISIGSSSETKHSEPLDTECVIPEAKSRSSNRPKINFSFRNLKDRDDSGSSHAKAGSRDDVSSSANVKESREDGTRVSKERTRDDASPRPAKEKPKEEKINDSKVNDAQREKEIKRLRELKAQCRVDLKAANDFVNELMKAKAKGTRKWNLTNRNIEEEIDIAQERVKRVLNKFHDSNIVLKNLSSSSSGETTSLPKTAEVPKKPARRLRYVDIGSYWCDCCNEVFNSLKDLFAHMHSVDYLQLMNCERHWPEAGEEYTERGVDYIDVPLRGAQFVIPVKGFYCSICKLCFPDQAIAERHMKGTEHNEQYMKYCDENPDEIQKYDSRRDRAISLFEGAKKRRSADVLKIARKIKTSLRKGNLAQEVATEKAEVEVNTKDDVETEGSPGPSVQKKICPQIVKFDFADKAKKKIIDELKAEKQASKPVIYIGKNLSMLSKKKAAKTSTKTSEVDDVSNDNATKDKDKSLAPSKGNQGNSSVDADDQRSKSLNTTARKRAAVEKAAAEISAAINNSSQAQKGEVHTESSSNSNTNKTNLTNVYGPELPPGFVPVPKKRQKMEKDGKKNVVQNVLPEVKSKAEPKAAVALNEIMLPSKPSTEAQSVALNKIELPKETPKLIPVIQMSGVRKAKYEDKTPIKKTAAKKEQPAKQPVSGNVMPKPIPPLSESYQQAVPKPKPPLSESYQQAVPKPPLSESYSQVIPKPKPPLSGSYPQVIPKPKPPLLESCQQVIPRPKLPLSEEEKDFLLLGINKVDMQPLVIPKRPPLPRNNSSNPSDTFLPPFPPPLHVPPPPLKLIPPCISVSHQVAPLPPPIRLIHPPSAITAIRPASMVTPNSSVPVVLNIVKGKTSNSSNSGIASVRNKISTKNVGCISDKQTPSVLTGPSVTKSVEFSSTFVSTDTKVDGHQASPNHNDFPLPIPEENCTTTSQQNDVAENSTKEDKSQTTLKILTVDSNSQAEENKKITDLKNEIKNAGEKVASESCSSVSESSLVNVDNSVAVQDSKSDNLFAESVKDSTCQKNDSPNSQSAGNDNVPVLAITTILKTSEKDKKENKDNKSDLVQEAPLGGVSLNKPDSLKITDNCIVNLQSTTNDKEVTEMTKSSDKLNIVGTDITETRVPYSKPDNSIMEIEPSMTTEAQDTKPDPSMAESAKVLPLQKVSNCDEISENDEVVNLRPADRDTHLNSECSLAADLLIGDVMEDTSSPTVQTQVIITQNASAADSVGKMQEDMPMLCPVPTIQEDKTPVEIAELELKASPLIIAKKDVPVLEQQSEPSIELPNVVSSASNENELSHQIPETCVQQSLGNREVEPSCILVMQKETSQSPKGMVENIDTSFENMQPLAESDSSTANVQSMLSSVLAQGDEAKNKSLDCELPPSSASNQREKHALTNETTFSSLSLESIASKDINATETTPIEVSQPCSEISEHDLPQLSITNAEKDIVCTSKISNDATESVKTAIDNDQNSPKCPILIAEVTSETDSVDELTEMKNNVEECQKISVLEESINAVKVQGKEENLMPELVAVLPIMDDTCSAVDPHKISLKVTEIESSAQQFVNPPEVPECILPDIIMPISLQLSDSGCGQATMETTIVDSEDKIECLKTDNELAPGPCSPKKSIPSNEIQDDADHAAGSSEVHTRSSVIQEEACSFEKLLCSNTDAPVVAQEIPPVRKNDSLAHKAALKRQEQEEAESVEKMFSELEALAVKQFPCEKTECPSSKIDDKESSSPKAVLSSIAAPSETLQTKFDDSTASSENKFLDALGKDTAVLPTSTPDSKESSSPKAVLSSIAEPSETLQTKFDDSTASSENTFLDALGKDTAVLPTSTPDSKESSSPKAVLLSIAEPSETLQTKFDDSTASSENKFLDALDKDTAVLPTSTPNSKESSSPEAVLSSIAEPSETLQTKFDDSTASSENKFLDALDKDTAVLPTSTPNSKESSSPKAVLSSIAEPLETLQTKCDDSTASSENKFLDALGKDTAALPTSTPDSKESSSPKTVLSSIAEPSETLQTKFDDSTASSENKFLDVLGKDTAALPTSTPDSTTSDDKNVSLQPPVSSTFANTGEIIATEVQISAITDEQDCASSEEPEIIYECSVKPAKNPSTIDVDSGQEIFVHHEVGVKTRKRKAGRKSIIAFGKTKKCCPSPDKTLIKNMKTEKKDEAAEDSDSSDIMIIEEIKKEPIEEHPIEAQPAGGQHLSPPVQTEEIQKNIKKEKNYKPEDMAGVPEDCPLISAIKKESDEECSEEGEGEASSEFNLENVNVKQEPAEPKVKKEVKTETEDDDTDEYETID